MKLNRTVGLLVVAAATIGAGAAMAAATTTTTTPATTTAPAGKHWHHHHGGMLVGMTLRASRQLNLTADQQQSIKNILATARAQHQQAGAAAAPDVTALGNPGDPNYATALQSAKSLAATRLESQAQLQSQIYNVLTADQKAKLPQVLADMKSKAEQRRAAWQQQHAAAAAGTAGSN
jgi:Spy/CpxP family protein refolding chaperone